MIKHVIRTLILKSFTIFLNIRLNTRVRRYLLSIFKIPFIRLWFIEILNTVVPTFLYSYQRTINI